MKRTFYTLSIALLVSVLFFSGCANPFDSKPDSGEAQGNLGRIAIQVGSPARTLQPELSGFSKYELAFTGPAGASHETKTIDTGTTAEVDLVPGAWTITITAFTGTGDAAKTAAQGSATVTVTANQTVDAAITLTPYTAADAAPGTLRYSVTYPAGIKDGTLVVTKADGTAVTNGTINLLEGGANPKTGTLPLAAGQYKMQIRLTANDDMIAGRTEALHIYPTLTSEAAYAFTGEDFVAFAEMADVTVSATATMDDPGTAVGNAETTITLYNETFVGILTTDDLSGWIANLPEGLSAKPKAGVDDGGTEVTLVITGTPTEGSDEALSVTIPADALTGGKDLIVQDNDDAKFAITLPEATAAVTAAANLGGQEGGDFNGSITLELTNDRFNAIAAETDLAAWFATALPAGLSAKTSAAVTAGTKTLTIAITGTPTAVVAATLLSITIPGAVLDRETALTADDTENKATITISVNEMAGVHLVGYQNISSSPNYYPGEYWKYSKAGVSQGKQADIPVGENQYSMFNTIIIDDADNIHLGGALFDENTYESNYLYQKNDDRVVLEPADDYFVTEYLALDGNDVYLLGEIFTGSYKVWKIAQGTPDTGTALSSDVKTPKGMIVIGDYLYLGGFTNGKAAYWKISKASPSTAAKVEFGDPDTRVTSMAVSGNTLYLGGYETTNSVNHAVYWKIDTGNNGDAVTKIPVESVYESTVQGITVSGNTVHLAGTWKETDKHQENAAYWQVSNDTTSVLYKITESATLAKQPNGTPITEVPPTYAFALGGIALDGTDVYITSSRYGNSTSTPATRGYWKIPGGNGTPQWVETPNFHPNAIAVR